MACFWKGINRQLHRVLKHRSLPPVNLAVFLKQRNTLPVSVCVQGKPLTKQEMKEHKEAIHVYDPKTVFQGYFCSTCDPFLCLLCQLFCVDIQHNYMGHKILYEHRCGNSKHMSTKKVLKFASNRGHFWAR